MTAFADPGDVNEHTVCERLGDSTCKLHQLTRADREERTAHLTKRRERRQREFAKGATVELSTTRKKTAHLATLLEYAKARVNHRGALARAYACRAARADAFEQNRLLMSRTDTYINRVIDSGDSGKEFRQRDMSIEENKLHWGEGNRTRSARLSRRLKTAFRHLVNHMWIEESGSTKFDCITGRELDCAWRKIIRKDGKEAWIKDRDVRFRKTEDALRSQHPFQVSPDILREKGGFKEEDLQRTAVCRDGNAAYTITCRVGTPRNQWLVPLRGEGNVT